MKKNYCFVIYEVIIMKISYPIVFIFLLISSCSYAQVAIRLDSDLEYPAISSPAIAITPQTNYFAQEVFCLDESFFWRKKYNADAIEKDAYFLHSLYIRDMGIGLRIFGMDFNPFYNRFLTYKFNQILRKNKLRFRFSVMMEYYPHDDYFVQGENDRLFSKPETYYNMINTDASIYYTHISKTSRGGSKTKERKGTWGIFFWTDIKKRMVADLHIQTGAYVLIKFRYKKYYSGKRVAFLTEIQLSKNGFKKTTVESSKDMYKGFSLVLGPEYNITNEEYMFTLGLKYSYRNH